MRKTLTLVGAAVASVCYLLGIRKQITIQNLERAYPGETRRRLAMIAHASYKNLGKVFAEFLYLRYASLRKIEAKTVISNPEVFNEAIQRKKGVVVVAAHYANWEWLALGGSLTLNSNFAIVRKNLPSSFFESFLMKIRIRSGNTLINSGDVRSMIRTIREGGCLALLGDQAAPSESITVDFFGIPTHTFEGPAWLAKSTGATMLFAECRLTTGSVYRITFHEVTYDDSDTILSLTQKHTSLLESIIREEPELWLWQHRRWKYSPQ